MWIDSSGDIKQVTCGFIYPDGSFYGTDEYKPGELTHEKILQHYGMKEEPGVIRFCINFIMLESASVLKRWHHDMEISDEYDIGCMTKQQSKILHEWLSAQSGSIFCPTMSGQKYQIRYLETLDDKLLTNIITIK